MGWALSILKLLMLIVLAVVLSVSSWFRNCIWSNVVPG
jgi:hypothetical protein